jgi:hypothetical protein
MGIALDSWARLIGLLERSAAGSAFAATAGDSTEAASGTDVFRLPAVAGAVSF